MCNFFKVRNLLEIVLGSDVVYKFNLLFGIVYVVYIVILAIFDCPSDHSKLVLHLCILGIDSCCSCGCGDIGLPVAV